MKRQKYITPACIVVEMETEELLALSQGELGEDTGAEPGKGNSDYDFDAVGGNPGGGYDVWDD